MHKELVKKALENVDFLLVQDVAETESLAFASLALPMTAPSEEEGSWTSAERRVQRMAAVLKPYGEAKPVWRACAGLLLRAKPGKPYFGAEEVFAEIASSVPGFSGLKIGSIGGEGTLLA